MYFSSQKSQTRLEQIRRDLQSEKQPISGQAMLDLLQWARKDERIHSDALPIFRAGMEDIPDSWTAINAARGIAHIVGATEGRQALLDLLNHPRTELVVATSQILTDASYVPDLLGVLQRRTEIPIQAAVVRTLGRLKDSVAYLAILERLVSPELRSDAVQALSDLGDPKAIPHLEPLLTDMTPLWPEDNHAPVLRMCDLAAGAIARLRGDVPAVALSSPKSYSAVVPTDGSCFSRKPYLAAYVPIMAATVSVPWIALVLLRQLYKTGKITSGPSETHRLDLIAMIPALIGLLVGVVVVMRGGRRGLGEKIWLWIGCAACAGIVFCFGWEFFH